MDSIVDIKESYIKNVVINSLNNWFLVMAISFLLQSIFMPYLNLNYSPGAIYYIITLIAALTFIAKIFLKNKGLFEGMDKINIRTSFLFLFVSISFFVHQNIHTEAIIANKDLLNLNYWGNTILSLLSVLTIYPIFSYQISQQILNMRISTINERDFRYLLRYSPEYISMAQLFLAIAINKKNKKWVEAVLNRFRKQKDLLLSDDDVQEILSQNPEFKEITKNA